MMYKNKFAVALKSAGRVLREFDNDTVYIPFGSEYSVFIKNLNSVKAIAKVEIDGVDVGDGQQFIVGANENLDLERFIKNGNFSQGNRFKFIERTAGVENHRGIGIEDGIIRVEWKFERKPEPFPNIGVYRSSSDASLYSCDVSSVSVSRSADNSPQVKSFNASVNEVGVTAPGSVSNQEFSAGSWFPTEFETHVIAFKVLGQTIENAVIQKPITVNTRPVCSSCGRHNKATSKFCAECGTSLNIV